MPLDLSFLDQTTPTPSSSVCPPCDSNVVVAHFTMSYFLGFNILSLSTSLKDAFCAALAVLASTSKVS